MCIRDRCKLSSVYTRITSLNGARIHPLLQPKVASSAALTIRHTLPLQSATIAKTYRSRLTVKGQVIISFDTRVLAFMTLMLIWIGNISVNLWHSLNETLLKLYKFNAALGTIGYLRWIQSAVYDVSSLWQAMYKKSSSKCGELVLSVCAVFIFVRSNGVSLSLFKRQL